MYVCTTFVVNKRIRNATHGIARIKSSVRLSLKRMDYGKTKESSAYILIPHEKNENRSS